MHYLLLLFLSLGLSSCVSLQSVSLTQIPKVRKKLIESEASKFIFLGFNFDNDFVDEVPKNLKEKCKRGKVTGLLTKDEVTNYIIAHRRTISAQGYCLR
ncbi:MAG: hypothetical protein AB8G05_24905 [Oligoflexales bacterium]